MDPVVGAAAEGEDGGPPVLGVVAFVFQAQQGVARALVGEAAVEIAPLDEDFRAGDQEIEQGGDGDGDGCPQGVDEKHDAQAAQRSQQGQRPMVAAERGPETGIVRDALVEARQIDGAVGHQEEHRDDGRDEIQVAREYPGLRDQEGDDDGAARLAGAAAAAAEELQAAEDAVAREGLEDAGGAHQAPQRGGQRGADHARVDQCAGQRAVLHHEPGAQQFRARHAGRQQAGDPRVERGGNADGRERAARNGPAGLFQVARHVDAGHDARDGREEQGEDRKQRVPGGPRRREVRAQRLRRKRQSRPGEKRRHGQQQHGQDRVLEADRPARADVHAQEDDQIRHRRRVAEGQAEIGERRKQRFGEAEHVERDGDRLRDEEEHGDDAAEFRPEAPADEVVGAAALDPHVRRDGRDRQPRDQRDDLRAGQDRQRIPQAGIAHHGVEPQEHDHAENRQQARREHAAEGAEPGGGREPGGLGFVAHGDPQHSRSRGARPAAPRLFRPGGVLGLWARGKWRRTAGRFSPFGRRSWDGSSVGRARAF